MILITGASGKTGRAILQALAQRGESARAVVRREEQAAEVRSSGAAEAVVADLRNEQAVNTAAQGCRGFYHIAPNMCPDELELGRIAIQAARNAGMQRFVYHSVLHPQTQDMPHHWNKLLVEEKLLLSGLNFTILQPAAYYQNTLAGLKAAREQGVFAQPYGADTLTSMVDLDDVAEAAARVLSETGHDYAIYELSGPEALSPRMIATALTQALGRPVQAEEIPHAAWEQRARAGGLDDYAVETLLKMFRYYQQHSFIGSPNTLRMLLGREPVRYAEFLRRALKNSLPPSVN